jgi:hypothetical protein
MGENPRKDEEDGKRAPGFALKIIAASPSTAFDDARLSSLHSTLTAYASDKLHASADFATPGTKAHRNGTCEKKRS